MDTINICCTWKILSGICATSCWTGLFMGLEVWAVIFTVFAIREEDYAYAALFFTAVLITYLCGCMAILNKTYKLQRLIDKELTQLSPDDMA